MWCRRSSPHLSAEEAALLREAMRRRLGCFRAVMDNDVDGAVSTDGLPREGTHLIPFLLRIHLCMQG